MARDEITRIKNPWNDLFAAGRKKIRGHRWDYLGETKIIPITSFKINHPDSDRVLPLISPRPSRAKVSGTGKRYQPLTDQLPAASGNPALYFPSVADFSNVKLSLSDTVVEKMPTFAV